MREALREMLDETGPATNYQRGYEAGLNGWRFDMAMKNNQDYLDGWNAGWKKRYFKTRVED